MVALRKQQTRAATQASVTVHITGRPPAPVLRYVDQVVGFPPAVQFRFSQGVLTAFDIDVVHVADPNIHLLLGTSHAHGYQQLLATLVLAWNLRRHRIALVRTLDPYGHRPRGRLQRLANRVLDRATTTFVTFDGAAVTPDAARTTVIPHAHYRDRFVGYPRGEMVFGRMLCISATELPRECRGLLALPRAMTTRGVTLRLAGRVPPAVEESTRSARALHSATVSVRNELLSDGAQVQEIDAAELVVLPKIEVLSDLQLVFLALSLDRPVLAPRTGATTRLAEEVGPGWMHLSDGPITAQVVDDAFASIRSVGRPAQPNLDGRDLTTIHAAYEAVFRAAVSGP